MKLTSLFGPIAVVCLIACGGSGDDSTQGGANALSNPSAPGGAPAPGGTSAAPASTTATPSTAPPPAPGTIAACAGDKTCIDTVVLRAIFASDLKITSDDTEESGHSAAEIVAEWLGKPNDGRITITVTPGAGTQSKVSINLAAGHETQTDEGDIEDFLFAFTIDGNKIVETSVDGQFAG
jgi:hypothetical protein